MKQRFAVIDLGTNTFHYMIIDFLEDGSSEVIDRDRFYVNLAEECIDEICPAAFQRGIEALKKSSQIFTSYQVSKIRAIGTAALRTAANGLEFIAAAKKETGIIIELVDGQKEAELIYQGVRQSISIQEPSLIMDIGGGSVELILADKNHIIEAKSFPIGIAVLFNQFIQSDPITSEEVAQIRNFIHQHTHSFFQKNAAYFPVKSLIGAAGSFEVLNQMIVRNFKKPISLTEFQQLFQSLLFTSYKERQIQDNIPISRARMLIPSLLLVDYFSCLAQIEKIVISTSALKEGVLQEMLTSNNF